MPEESANSADPSSQAALAEIARLERTHATIGQAIEVVIDIFKRANALTPDDAPVTAMKILDCTVAMTIQRLAKRQGGEDDAFLINNIVKGAADLLEQFRRIDQVKGQIAELADEA